ncbi:MAG TPA: FecR domain-containing protein [Accumulibacter sp.]|nr:FecR domain-containing protein [Accumulibacter sp.]HMW17128.1 FecR domain-containing protein [Accumulibacter sp.]HMX22380.1 FecR domain-containing protein [Accumulibacter sp.]HMY05839.1 FecR domain-containing protein [Accumulibacter sp.]HNC17440.1 FecR domain-containing protein [Accumulibacter sp.]
MNRCRVPTTIGACCSALIYLSPSATAAEKTDAYVDGLLMPAAIERRGERQPLTPGFVLENRDRLSTGEKARLRIRLGDGGTVALGADSSVEINALGVRESSLFSAAFDLKHGVLRYSATSVGAERLPHAVNLRFGSITVSSRGNDLLWGQAGKEADRVCLLDGSITAVHPSSEPRQLDQPFTCYAVSRGEEKAVVETVSSEQFAAYVAQTDMLVEKSLSGPVAMQGISDPQQQISEQPLSDRPMTRRPLTYRPMASHGGSLVPVATVDTQADALAVYDRLRTAGHSARIKPFAAGGGYRYHIFSSRQLSGDAAALSPLPSALDR